ncbi:MAG: hypothetical protein ACRED1_08225, partial [Limisphaerales bacterium]
MHGCHLRQVNRKREQMGRLNFFGGGDQAAKGPRDGAAPRTISISGGRQGLVVFAEIISRAGCG